MSKTERGVAELARNVRPDGIERYLIRRGWSLLGGRRAEVRRFTPPGNTGEFTLLTPAVVDLDDYAEVVARMVQILSRVEQRSEFDVLAQMVEPCDVLRAQVASIHTKDGSIPLGRCISLVQGMQDLVTYAACAELSPAPAHPRKLKEAIELADRSKFGQTDVGSFIATLYYPVRLDDESRQISLLGDGPPPLHRRITARIVRGLSEVARASAQGVDDPLVEGHKEGFTANMCAALAEVVEAFPGGSCTFYSNFDPVFPPPADVPAGPIVIPTDVAPILNSAAERLEPSMPPRDVEVDGYVTQLQHGMDESEEAPERAKVYPFRVWVLWNDKGEARTVEFELDEKSYKQALNAHDRGARVRVRGRLEKVRRKWMIRNPDGFTVD